MPLYRYWCNAIKEKPRFHRKQWEFVYIAHVLYERGFLKSGISAIGFGVGKEPLVACFANHGVKVTATDLDREEAKQLGWIDTNQYSIELSELNDRGLCDENNFKNLVEFKVVNMNNIPHDIGMFDFCWSSCAFEHLGSIRKGLDFVKNSARLLKPGGIAVHTTEYNLNSNIKTLDNNPSYVIFRKKDIEQLINELETDKYTVETIDFNSGEDKLEKFIDTPPYSFEPHLRLLLEEKYVTTSIGIIIHAKKNEAKNTEQKNSAS